jgi:hypothetical protein
LKELRAGVERGLKAVAAEMRGRARFRKVAGRVFAVFTRDRTCLGESIDVYTTSLEARREEEGQGVVDKS